MNIIEINRADNYHCSQLTRSTGFTSLMYLVINTKKHPEYFVQIEYILENYPDEINNQNTKGWTALMLICRNIGYTSTLDTLELLLKYKPDFYLETINCETAFHLSIFLGYFAEIVTMLIKYGLNINHINSRNYHMLMDLVIYREYQCIKILLEITDVDLYIQYIDGHSIYDFIKECDDPIINKMIEEYIDNSCLDLKCALD
jgi:ankyrin repeat protein